MVPKRDWTTAKGKRCGQGGAVPYRQSRDSIMVKFITSLFKDNSGASAAEYALILAIVGTGIAGAAIYLGGTIGNSMNDAGGCIAAPSNATC